MTAFIIHSDDNVATALDDLAVGEVPLRGAGDAGVAVVREPVQAGHKVALRDLDAGDAVVKYGVTIGVAKDAITAGSWVHLHNCASRFDERSNTLDAHSGAPTEKDVYL